MKKQSEKYLRIGQLITLTGMMTKPGTNETSSGLLSA